MAKAVQVNLKNLLGAYKGAKNLGSKEGIKQIGQKVKHLNLDQIEKEKEADGNTVKPYNDKYAEKKGERRVTYVGKKSTYSKKKRGGGHMMNAFGVISKRGQALVGFLSKTARKKAKWNAEHRNFIGLTKKNTKALFKWIKKKFM